MLTISTVSICVKGCIACGCEYPVEIPGPRQCIVEFPFLTLGTQCNGFRIQHFRVLTKRFRILAGFRIKLNHYSPKAKRPCSNYR